MNLLLLTVLTVAQPSTTAWQYGPNELVFAPDSSGWLHVWHKGSDLGRAASGTVLTDGVSMVFMADEIFHGSFQ